MLRLQWLICISSYSHLVIFCASQSNLTERPVDFETLTKQPSMFVDKTMLLEILFDDFSPSADRRIISITTPRGFCRTTNLDMIARFAGIETDPQGYRINKFNTSSYRIFNPNAEPKLAISKLDHLIRDHLAKYPVVYLDLSNVTTGTLRQTIRNLHERVKKTYRKFAWLQSTKFQMAKQMRDSLEHTKHRKDWRFINKILSQQVNALDIHTSIGKLIGVLVEIFHQKAILLIDNYDAPIMDAVYQQSNTSVDQFYEFFEFFFSTTLDDSANDTQLVILAGTHPVSIKTRTEIDFYSFLNQHDLGQYFGFTETEVEQLLGPNLDSTSMQDLRNHFGGYLANGSSTSLYRPASIIKFCKSISDGNDDVSGSLPCCDPQIEKLVKKFMQNVSWEQDKGIEGSWGGRSFEITPRIELDQLERISNVVNGKENATGGNMDTYFGILFANGYFAHSNDSDPDVISFPNLQMMKTFQKYLS